MFKTPPINKTKLIIRMRHLIILLEAFKTYQI